MKIKRLIAILASLSILATSTVSLAAETDPEPVTGTETIEESVEDAEPAKDNSDDPDTEVSGIEEQSQKTAEKEEVTEETNADDEDASEIGLAIAADPVAMVDGVEYATIDEAVAVWAADDCYGGKTLTLLSDVEYNSTVKIKLDRTKSQSNTVLNLGDHTWTAVGCNAFEMVITGATPFHGNSGFYINATENGGITVDSDKYCIKYTSDNKCAESSDTRGYRPRLDILGGTYNGKYIVYHMTSAYSSSTGGPSTTINKGSDGSIPVFNGGLALGKSRVYFYSGIFNGDINTYTVTTTSDTNIYAGVKFKNLVKAGNDKIVSYNGNYIKYEDEYWNVVSAEPDEYRATVPASLVYNGTYSITSKSGYTKEFVYFDDPVYAINNYSNVNLFEESETVVSTPKTISSRFTLNSARTNTAYPENKAVYNGDIVLNKGAEFVVTANDERPYTGTVSASDSEKYRVVHSEVKSDGITTTTYSLEEIIKATLTYKKPQYSWSTTLTSYTETHPTFARAIVAVNNFSTNTYKYEDTTITMNDDLTAENVILNTGRTVVVDLNGKKLSNETGSSAAMIINNATLTISDTGEGGAVNNNGTAAAINNLGTLSITGGTWSGPVVSNNGVATITGGTFKGNEPIAADAVNVTVTGGTFDDGSSENVSSHIADGYGAFSNGDGTYTVKRTAAMIGEVKYLSLAEAVSAAVSGDVIELKSDMGSETVAVDGITIKPSGYAMPVSGDGYFWTDNGDGTWTINKSATTVTNVDTMLSTTVTLDNLEKNLQSSSNAHYDGEAAAEYNVVLSEAPNADKEKIETKLNEIAAAATPAPTDAPVSISKVAETYDISVYKTESGTTEKVDMTGITQKVTLTVGKPIKEGTKPLVLHVIANGTVEVIDDVNVDSAYAISFTTTSFSTFYVEYETEQSAVQTDDIAAAIDVTFENKTLSSDGTSVTYDLVLNGKNTARDAEKLINRFMSSKWAFALKGNTVSYEILPVTHVSMTENDQYAEYPTELNMSGKEYSDASGKKITIAKIKITGTGDYAFTITKGTVHTSKVADNIVEDFLTGGTLGLTGTDSGVDFDNGSETQTQAKGTLATAKGDLTVNISFPNKAANNEYAYQDMTLTISGGDLSADKVVKLGSFEANTTAHLTETGAAVTYTDATETVPASYQVVFDDELTQNVAYTVKVEGAGYRTARYTVNMGNTAKTLNFWNNVKDETNKAPIELGKAEMQTNFLAGDIVKDNKINIYDLSAVVSYFGTTGLSVNNHPDYAKYDLNRDNQIDSKDIAYVLVSWDK